jgi:hypothetical protein
MPQYVQYRIIASFLFEGVFIFGAPWKCLERVVFLGVPTAPKPLPFLCTRARGLLWKFCRPLISFDFRVDLKRRCLGASIRKQS